MIVPESVETEAPPGERDLLLLGGEKFSKVAGNQPLITDTTLRDAHQSLSLLGCIAFDMLEWLILLLKESRSFQLGNVGRCHLRYLHAGFWGNVPTRDSARFVKIPNVLFQMLLHGSDTVGYANYRIMWSENL